MATAKDGWKSAHVSILLHVTDCTYSLSSKSVAVRQPLSSEHSSSSHSYRSRLEPHTPTHLPLHTHHYGTSARRNHPPRKVRFHTCIYSRQSPAPQYWPTPLHIRVCIRCVGMYIGDKSPLNIAIALPWLRSPFKVFNGITYICMQLTHCSFLISTKNTLS